MQLTQENSEIIQVLRFPLIVGVVLIHTFAFDLTESGHLLIHDHSGANLFTQVLFSQVLARVAVPLFFLFAGFLLFSEENLSWEVVRGKWNSRFYSLVTPYVIWNSIVVAIQLLGQSFSFTRAGFSGTTISLDHLSWTALLNAYLGISGGPANYPLWFLRDLICLIVLSPLILFVLKRAPIGTMVLLTLAWCGFFVEMDLFPVLSEGAVLFFTAGLLIRRTDTEFVESKLRKISVCLSLMALLLLTSVLEAVLFLKGHSTFFLHKTNILLGATATYGLGFQCTRLPRLKQALLMLAPVSFFVYLAHSNLLQLYRKLTDHLLHPDTDLSMLTVYFAVPCLTIITLVTTYFFMQKYFPEALNFFTGNRTLSTTTATVVPVQTGNQ